MLGEFVKHNETLYSSMKDHFENGLKSLTIPPDVCKEFHKNLMQAYQDGREDKEGRFKNNELVLYPTEKASR